jgi:hypothetical protein
LDSHNKLSSEVRKEEMKVHYDKKADAVYIKLGTQKPDGVIEISEGVNLDTTSENKIGHFLRFPVLVFMNDISKLA